MIQAGRRLSPLLAATLLLLLVAPAPAHALDVTTGSRVRVIGGLSEQQLTVRVANGDIARGRVLRFSPDARNLELRPVMAQGTAAGIETMRSMTRRQARRGAAVGVNGGYWLSRPEGVPNGLYVHEGRLVGGQSVGRSGMHVDRGNLGITAAGALIMDRLGVDLTLTRPDGETVAVDEINRAPRITGTFSQDEELIVFDPLYGAPVDVPADSVVVEVDRMAIGSSGQASGTVRSVDVYARPASITIPTDRTLLVAYGAARERLTSIVPGTNVTVTTQVSSHNTAADAWDQLEYAMPGGPLLLFGGEHTNRSSRDSEAFSDDHVGTRHPRTALARTGDGYILLVTVDGRQNGWSAGLTLHELSQTLVQLGAVDALNLDGGGSTTMTVGSEIVNRPSEQDRSVANALYVYAPLPPGARDLTDGACDPDDVADAGFDDTGASPHEATIDCLAWWGITQGVTPDRYEPGMDVSRAAMATFVTNYVTDAARRGSGRALPDADDSPFVDVDIDSTHGSSIARLEAAGIVNGRTSSLYAPKDPVSRQEMATFVARAHEYVTGSALPEGRDQFVDDTGGFHENNIDRLASAGIVAGTLGLEYSPLATVRRSAMSAFLMRAADVLVDEGVTSPPG